MYLVKAKDYDTFLNTIDPKSPHLFSVKQVNNIDVQGGGRVSVTNPDNIRAVPVSTSVGVSRGGPPPQQVPYTIQPAQFPPGMPVAQAPQIVRTFGPEGGPQMQVTSRSSLPQSYAVPATLAAQQENPALVSRQVPSLSTQGSMAQYVGGMKSVVDDLSKRNNHTQPREESPSRGRRKMVDRGIPDIQDDEPPFVAPSSSTNAMPADSVSKTKSEMRRGFADPSALNQFSRANTGVKKQRRFEGPVSPNQVKNIRPTSDYLGEKKRKRFEDPISRDQTKNITSTSNFLKPPQLIFRGKNQDGSAEQNDAPQMETEEFGASTSKDAKLGYEEEEDAGGKGAGGIMHSRRRKTGDSKNLWGKAKNAKHIDLFAQKWVEPGGEMEAHKRNAAADKHAATQSGTSKSLSKVVKTAKDILGKKRLKTSQKEVAKLLRTARKKKAAEVAASSSLSGGPAVSERLLDERTINAAVQALLAMEVEESEESEEEGEAPTINAMQGSRRGGKGKRAREESGSSDTEAPAAKKSKGDKSRARTAPVKRKRKRIDDDDDAADDDQPARKKKSGPRGIKRRVGKNDDSGPHRKRQRGNDNDDYIAF